MLITWPQFMYAASHTGFNPFERMLWPASAARLTKLWNVPLNAEGGTLRRSSSNQPKTVGAP